jgi:hypothetical protein
LYGLLLFGGGWEFFDSGCALKSEIGRKCVHLERSVLEVESALKRLRLPVELTVYTDKTFGNDKVRSAEVARRLDQEKEYTDLIELLDLHSSALNLTRVDFQESVDNLSILKLQARLELARLGQCDIE